MMPVVALDDTDRQLLQHLQDDFPLARKPWTIIGERLGLTGEEVLRRVQRLVREGVVRSIGPVVDARKVGLTASTLVALHVPEARLLEVARVVGGRPGVSHCYERYHPLFNLWFTLSMPDRSSMVREMRWLLEQAHVPAAAMLDLPVTRRFKVDVRYRFAEPSAWGDRA